MYCSKYSKEWESVFFGITYNVQFQRVARLFTEFSPAENVLGSGKLSIVSGQTLFSKQGLYIYIYIYIYIRYKIINSSQKNQTFS